MVKAKEEFPVRFGFKFPILLMMFLFPTCYDFENIHETRYLLIAPQI